MDLKKSKRREDIRTAVHRHNNEAGRQVRQLNTGHAMRIWGNTIVSKIGDEGFVLTPNEGGAHIELKTKRVQDENVCGNNMQEIRAPGVLLEPMKENWNSIRSDLFP